MGLVFISGVDWMVDWAGGSNGLVVFSGLGLVLVFCNKRVRLVYMNFTRANFVIILKLRGCHVIFQMCSKGPMMLRTNNTRTTIKVFHFRTPGDQYCRFPKLRDQNCKFLKLFIQGLILTFLNSQGLKLTFL